MARAKPPKAVYDAFGAHYDAMIHDPAESSWNRVLERPAMAALLRKAVQGKAVADIGCGSGIFTAQLQKWDVKSVIGVDFSRTLLDIAKDRHPEIPFHYGTATQTGLPASVLDVVTSSMVLHYLKNLDTHFREVRRILKSGGIYVFPCHHPLFQAYGANPFRKNVKAREVHMLFSAYLERLKPSKEFLNLFRAVLLRDWGERYKELNRESIELQQRELDLAKEKKNVVKLMTDNANNPAVVNAMVTRLKQLDKELTFTSVTATEKKIEAYDAETVINYCVHYMENVSELWRKAPVEQQYCFQSLIFPDKLPYDVLLDKRTPKLSPLYAVISELQTSESDLAAPRGIEPRLTD